MEVGLVDGRVDVVYLVAWWVTFCRIWDKKLGEVVAGAVVVVDAKIYAGCVGSSMGWGC
jgi:hypothetical protein